MTCGCMWNGVRSAWRSGNACAGKTVFGKTVEECENLLDLEGI